MSRSGWSDDWDADNWQMICAAGAIKQAVRGKRGQALLREMLIAFDGMAVKELVAQVLEEDGDHCALGVVGSQRGIGMKELDPEDAEQVARAFQIAPTLVRQIVYENDDGGSWKETPAERWQRMRAWVARQIVPTQS